MASALLATTCRISIHSLLAEGDGKGFTFYAAAVISIHSLLAEGDKAFRKGMMLIYISIHSLLAEGDCTAVR